jgi:hypothetical protein
MLATAMLVSVAIGLRVAASVNSAAVTDALDRPGVSVHSGSTVVHHVQVKWRAELVRSGGPLPAQRLADRTVSNEQSRAFSRARVALKDATTLIAYDATAPPQSLLT